MNRDEKRKFVRDSIMTGGEVTNYLGFSNRSRLNQLVKMGTIEPVKRGLYLTDDIVSYQRKRAKKMQLKNK